MQICICLYFFLMQNSLSNPTNLTSMLIWLCNKQSVILAKRNKIVRGWSGTRKPVILKWTSIFKSTYLYRIWPVSIVLRRGTLTEAYNGRGRTKLWRCKIKISYRYLVSLFHLFFTQKDKNVLRIQCIGILFVSVTLRLYNIVPAWPSCRESV